MFGPFDPDRPAADLDLSGVGRARSRRLERLARKRTIGELLDRVHGEDADLILERASLLEATRAGGPREPPAIGDSVAAWTQWGRANHMLPSLERPYTDFLPTWLRRHSQAQVTVLDLVTSKPRSRARQVLDRHYGLDLDQLVDMLVETAVQMVDCLEYEAERQEQRGTRPDNGLALLWDEVNRCRAPIREKFVALPPRGFQVRVDLGELELEVMDADHTLSAIVELEPVPSIRCFDTPGYSLQSLDALLDWITDPALEPDRAPLVRELDKPAWERGLDRLAEWVPPQPLAESEDKRLLGFEVDLEPREVRSVQCRPAKRGDTWVTRRVDVFDVPEVLVTARDRRVLEAARPDGAARSAFLALVGHPRVFLAEESRKKAVAVRRGRLALACRRAGDRLHLEFERDGEPVSLAELSGPGAWRDMVVDRVGDALRITPIERPVSRAIAAVSRSGGLQVPIEQLDRLLALLPDLAEAIPLDADATVLGKPVDGDARPLVALRWDGDSLAASVRFQPLPEAPPAVPGAGAGIALARRGERVVHVRRDLAGEPGRARAVLESLGLGDLPVGDDFEVFLPDPQRALGVVEQLRERADLRVAWEGDRLTLGEPATADALFMRVESGQDWFGIRGELKRGRRRVSLEVLLRAALEGHRYVELGKGHWVALDGHLRSALAAAAGTGEEAQLSAIHAPILESLASRGATIDAPPEWLELRDRLAQAAELEVQVPDGLRAELRGYQVEGLQWLARLAHWAPGAVLADDMGLGKTIQAIALLLRRAERGPALVVAPTSVVRNWQAELSRFAPELEVVVHHGAGRSRSLEPVSGQVVLTSYGVLINDAEALGSVRFATAVLDESQAIKNATTRRARAAHGLDAAFRLALSGTPVENRVGELFSLFRFVAPGLLGTARQFEDHYVGPIEGRGDTARRAALAALVAPFLLRRTKDQVAMDLPPKTEIQLDVELGDDERALYERTRLDAVERVLNAGAKRSFQVLEELTRLRKQACNPRLNDPGSAVPSAKLKAALRVLRDLREGGHRALVFSSFVSHLGLIRAELEAEGFACRWLDGSTPMNRRAAEVDAFQDGQGDVFLISLKAGGVGLNLTAASYVLHLDPWWNPAAEDQASDRAHRIGQDKPVTVYRLVARDTVEAKIVELHAHKRELADALLQGAGTTRMPSADELVALLDDPGRPVESQPERPRLTLVSSGGEAVREVP